MNDNKLLDEENYFDQAEAVYTYCMLNHEGQWSVKYRVMCSIDFKPGHSWSESDVEENNIFYSEVSNWTDEQLEQFSSELDEFLTQDDEEN